MLKVLICDDDQILARAWADDIARVLPPDTYELLPLPSKQGVRAGIESLISRRTRFRDGGDYGGDECLFDGVDILLVDYDLIHIDNGGTRFTGEGVARLARTYSNCHQIVVLNQFIEHDFDLSLRGHLSSHADLNVTATTVASPGLWGGPPWEGFRPWHWPVLSQSASAFEARLASLCADGALEQPVLGCLHIDEEDSSFLSDDAFGFLSPQAQKANELSSVTFLDFLKDNSLAVDVKDGLELVERAPEACARISAARVAKWLERDVLGPQEILVDLPHMMQRFPYLVDGDISDVSVWNGAMWAGKDAFSAVPAECWYEAGDWLTKPAVWTRRLEEHPDVRARRAQFDFSKLPDFVFAEDVSRFVAEAEAREFRADFHNPFDRRHVMKLQGRTYAPQRRFAFGL